MAVALASLWGLLGGCREQTTAPIDRNQPPETFITAAPGDSQTAFYRVSMHWGGSDNDGLVSSFDVAVTESLPKLEIQWRRTLRSDSTMIIPVGQTQEVLGHRFYVRAIDNEGKVDPTPAWVFFGAKDNISPTIIFPDTLSAIAYWTDDQTGGQRIKALRSSNPDFPTDTIPAGAGVRFRWTGRDDSRALAANGDTIVVGSITRFSYRLLPIESQFHGDSVTSTHADYAAGFFNLHPHGNVYAFNVSAVDDAGLSGSGTATRSFVWNMDPVTRIYSDPVQHVRQGFISRGQIHHEFDTLMVAVGSENTPDVNFMAEGYDPDPPNGDHSVQVIEWRYNPLASFTAWARLNGPQSLTNLPSGDYVLMARSEDQLDRFESTPDSLIFYVNQVPRFITQSDPSNPVYWPDHHTPFRQFPMPNETISIAADSLVQLGGIRVKLCATDPDSGAGDQLKYGYHYAENAIDDYSQHASVRPVRPVTFVARRPQGFHPGVDSLSLIVVDNAQPGGQASRGQRTKSRMVRFIVVP